MSYDFSYCCSINDQLINMQNKLRMNGSFQEPINSHATSETLKSTNDGSQAVTELNSQTHTRTNDGSQAVTELNSQTQTGTNDGSQAETELNSQTHTRTNDGSQAVTELNSQTQTRTNDCSQAVTELNSQTHTGTNEGSQAETELNSQTHTTNDCSQAKSYDELLTKLDSISFTSQDSIKRTACWIVKIYINNAREYCNYWKKMFLQGEVLNKHILTIY